MVLALQMLSEDAELNNYEIIDAAKFVPGMPVKVVMQLMQTVRDIRYVPDVASTFEVTLFKSDGTTITKTPVFLDSGDRSLITFDLTGAETQELISQDIQVTVSEPGGNSAAQLRNAISNANTIGC